MNRNTEYVVCHAGMSHSANLRHIRRMRRSRRSPETQPSLFERVLDFFGVLVVSKPAKSIRPRRTRLTY